MTESLYQLTDTDSEEEREPSQHRDTGSRARDCGQWSLDITDGACVNARQSDDGRDEFMSFCSFNNSEIDELCQ